MIAFKDFDKFGLQVVAGRVIRANKFVEGILTSDGFEAAPGEIAPVVVHNLEVEAPAVKVVSRARQSKPIDADA